MKNLKKIDRKDLKRINGGFDPDPFCSLTCPPSKECKFVCGLPQCVPRGEYIPPNC